MELRITPEAQAFLQKKFPDAKKLLLALNDGSNRFSSAEGCCMIGDRFMVIITDVVPPEFFIQLANPAYEVYITEYETTFLTETPILAVNETTGSLMLKSAGGIIDINVQVKTAER